jgi:hypothetical protein
MAVRMGDEAGARSIRRGTPHGQHEPDPGGTPDNNRRPLKERVGPSIVPASPADQRRRARRSHARLLALPR